MWSKRASGFTIIELFVVLGLIAIFALFLLPVWAAIQMDAREVRCRESLGQIGRGVALYTADHKDSLPGCQHSAPSWVDGLAIYVSPNAFVCPEQFQPPTGKPLRWNYALNDFLTPHPYGARHLNFARSRAVPSPSETMMFGEVREEYGLYDHFHFADTIENGYSPAAFSEQVDIERHDRSANYLFSDGHVEILGWSTGAKPKLVFPGSKFVHPAGESSVPAELARR